MKISEVENFIKTRKTIEIDISPRVEEKLKERNLNIKEIKQMLLNNEILGIVNQGDEVYKLWLEYTKDYDLNVVIRIKGSKCYIVTAFPCDTERRVKHEKTTREKG